MDTTVQEKNITFPTDSKLLYKAIRKLGDAAKSRGIPLRQSYVSSLLKNVASPLVGDENRRTVPPTRDGATLARREATLSTGC